MRKTIVLVVERVSNINFVTDIGNSQVHILFSVFKFIDRTI